MWTSPDFAYFTGGRVTDTSGRRCMSSRDRGHLTRGSAMDLGRYLVDAVVLEHRSYRDVAKAHGVSKSLVAKLVSRFREGGYEAVAPRSRAPHRTPHRTSDDLEDRIMTLRKLLADA